jgi:hypothetical protein
MRQKGVWQPWEGGGERKTILLGRNARSLEQRAPIRCAPLPRVCPSSLSLSSTVSRSLSLAGLERIIVYTVYPSAKHQVDGKRGG